MDEHKPGDSAAGRLKVWLLGKPRELRDPTIFRRVALVSVLAWIGLGANGLSSASYGPEGAYTALGVHGFLAVPLALAAAATVFVIAWSYSRLIEAFPSGGGGYVAPFKLLGPTAGAMSGSALIIDYVLTIAVSVGAGVDAIYSNLPETWRTALIVGFPVKLLVGGYVIFVLMVLNLRGVKESLAFAAPIFAAFLVTHVMAFGAGLVVAAPRAEEILTGARASFDAGFATVGLGGLALLFLQAYALGGGTYTGIESVANGMNIVREPVVRNAKRTLLYMSVTLAITAAGILVFYWIFDAKPQEGRTLNAVLFDRIASSWTIGNFPIGRWFAVVTLATEAALLFLAAQAGFIAGVRVMASMAVDSWLPHRFAALSERLTMRNSIQLLSLVALAVYWYTGGSVAKLVVLYSINVFLTFSISNVAMCVRAVRSSDGGRPWIRPLIGHLAASALCITILIVTLVVKLDEGAWVTLILTGVLLVVCILIRRQYAQTRTRLRRLEDAFANLPGSGQPAPPIDAAKPAAILFVESYGGLGVHTLLSIFRAFPGYFHNVVFVTIGVIDSGNFKGAEELEALRASASHTVARYVDLATRLGIAAAGEWRVGTDAVGEAEEVAAELGRRYPRHMFFGGRLIFRRDPWYERLLHNETALAIQRRLQWKGLPMTILPVRVFES